MLYVTKWDYYNDNLCFRQELVNFSHKSPVMVSVITQLCRFSTEAKIIWTQMDVALFQ